MSQLPCPHCRGVVEYVRELAGKPVACPHCGKQFTLPPSTSTAAPVPAVKVRRGSASGLADRHRPSMTAATSWFDLFDFKFEKYLTPWIIRLTWAVALVVSAVWLAMLLFGVVWTLIPSAAEANLSQTQLRAEQELTSPGLEAPETESPRSRLKWRPLKLPPQVVLATAMALTTIIAIMVCLLWVRVFLETVIVVFNIATTLKDIERKLTPGGPRS